MTTVGSGTTLTVSSGQTLDGVIVLSGGVLSVLLGGISSNIEIDDGGSASIYGAAYDTTIQYGGFEQIQLGSADHTTINSGGLQFIGLGATASNTIVDGIQVIAGTTSSTTINAGGIVFEESGGPPFIPSLTDVTINTGGFLFVGGPVHGSLAANSGTLVIQNDLAFDDGVLSGLDGSNAILSGGGTLVVGGLIADLGPWGNGKYFGSGFAGFANGELVINGTQGLDAFAIVVNTGGYELISSNVSVTGTTILGGEQDVYGNAVNTTVHGGEQDVYGTAHNTVVDAPIDALSYQVVETGGTAIGTIVNTRGVQELSGSGAASGTTVNVGGLQFVGGFGTATGTIIKDGGEQKVYGSTNGTTIDSGGLQSVLEFIDSTGTATRGSASGTIINAGELDLFGGNAIDTVDNGGTIYVWQSSTAISTTLNGGHEQVGGGTIGTTIGTIVNDGGTELVVEGGTARGSTINSGGREIVLSGAVTTDPTISGGTLTLQTGALVTGTIDLTGSGGTLELLYADPATTTARLDASVLTVHTVDATFQFQIAGANDSTFTVQPGLDFGGTDIVFTLTADHPPAIDVTHSVVTGTISKASTGGIDSATGAVAFNDLDLSDRPEASIVSKSVIVKDAYGNIDTLTDAQNALLKQAFTIAPEAGNTNDGAIDWKFDLPNQSLSFLRALDTTVTLTALIQIDDLHGGTVSQTVTVNLVFDPYIPYVDANPGHPTPADVVGAALQYQHSLWNSDNCTGLVWAVTEAIVQPFGEPDTQVPGFNSDPTHVPDQGFAVPPNGVPPGQYGSWLTIETSNWRSIVQPGDLVRIPGTNVQGDPLIEGHSFIVISKDSLGNWLVIDNTDPNHAAGTGAGPIIVSEHTFNPAGQFGQEVLNADVAYVSRLETGPSTSFTGITVVGTSGLPLTYGNAAAFLDGSKLQNQIITVGNGNDFVTAGSHDTVKLGQGGDVVQAGSNDTISAGNGNDQITAGSNTIITLGNGNDTIFAGSKSTVVVGNGNDTISVGANSSVTVGNGNDSIAAEAGSIVTLGNGNDTVKAVSSLIHAGAGYDTFVFVGNFGQSTITNFNLQKDTIGLDHFAFASIATVFADMSRHGADTVIDDGHGNNITLVGVSIAQLQAHQSDFHLI